MRNDGKRDAGTRPFKSGEGMRKNGEYHPCGGNGHPNHSSSGMQSGRNGTTYPPFGARPAESGRKTAFGGAQPHDRPMKPVRQEENHAPSGERTHSFPKRAEFDEKNKRFGGDNHPQREVNHQRSGGFVGNNRQHPAERRYGRPAPARPLPARPAPTDGLPARRLALEVIRQVTENGAYASLALDEKLSRCGLSPEDRRLASRLVYDTLENLLYLDHALNQVMTRPDTELKLRNVLRLGACQILLEDRIPESAATNTSVNLCKEIGMEGLAGVCNGVLRNLIRQKETLSWPDAAAEPMRALSVRYSLPAFLAETLCRDWGMEQTVALLRAKPENTYITVRPNLMELDDAGFEALLGKKVWAWEKGPVPCSWRIRGMADVGRDADFTGGRFSIQSEGSILTCLAVAPRRGMTVLDACAAPGGKACLMAEMMGGTGRVMAWDVHPHRVDLIEAQCRRLRLENVRPIVRDARKMREELVETMDAVLLDAPCSGTGDMLDKPDVKYRVSQESVAELVETQRQLLDAVAPYVKRGGVLVYSTCSVLRDENDRQVEAFLARHPEFELAELPETIPERFRAHAGVGLQLLPQRDGVGGFYLARMRRKRL